MINKKLVIISLILSTVIIANGFYSTVVVYGDKKTIDEVKNEPSILLADELTGNLDPITSNEIMELLIEINNRGTTVIMATHDTNIVNSLKKRVIGMKNGTIILGIIKYIGATNWYIRLPFIIEGVVNGASTYYTYSCCIYRDLR